MSLLAEIGAGLVSTALAASLYTAAAAGYAARRGRADWARGAQVGSLAATGLLAVAIGLLLGALLTDHFELAYVAAHSSRALPPWLKVSALWGGQEGSLLLWSFLQALVATLFHGRRSATTSPFRLWTLCILSIIAASFTGVTLLLSNPFGALPVAPADGAGLNPLLRHLGMALHPPALYLGYVGLAVPYACALAALITGDLSAWLPAARRWTAGAWLFLGLGLLLGARWAYDVLGWGGYWGWDPVENAGLLPWLTATGLLHGALAGRGRRFAAWNLSLALLSFLLVLFGTYATRSGAIQSVHAYTLSSVGSVYLSFLALAALVPLVLLPGRWRLLRGDAAAEAPSRQEGAVFLTLVILAGLTFSVFVGSVLPSISAALTGRRLEAGPDWFERVCGPQFAALLVVMGIGPLLARSPRRSRGRWLAGLAAMVALPAALAFAGFQHPLGLFGLAVAGLALGSGAGTLAERALHGAWRGTGGPLVHLGVAIIAVGVIGTRLYPQEARLGLTVGTPIEWGGYSLVYDGLRVQAATDYVAQRVTVTVSGGGRSLAGLHPELREYAGSSRAVPVPAVYSAWREDLYIVLTGIAPDDRALLILVRNPLIRFLWLGGLVALVGGVISLWPASSAARDNVRGPR